MIAKMTNGFKNNNLQKNSELFWKSFCPSILKLKELSLAVFFLMIMSGTFSQANNQCGEYELKGVLRYKESENKQFIYVVNEGTQSETHFFIETIEQLKKVASLINRPTKISVQLTKPLDGTRGYVNEVIFVKLRKSDPLLHGGDTGYELVKSMPCQ